MTKELKKLSAFGLAIRELLFTGSLKNIKETSEKILPFLGANANHVQFKVWNAYFQQGADETTLTRHHPPFPGSSSRPYTVINIFHHAKPEHFCSLLLVDADAAVELQKVSQQKNGLLKGRVKLSTEGLDEENQAVELKDYGQYPWGLCEGY